MKTIALNRNLFWVHLIRNGHSVWLYIMNIFPLASVWYDEGEWHYAIPIHSKEGAEEYQIDAFARVEKSLAD